MRHFRKLGKTITDFKSSVGLSRRLNIKNAKVVGIVTKADLLKILP